jgi:hypothetical protein
MRGHASWMMLSAGLRVVGSSRVLEWFMDAEPESRHHRRWSDDSLTGHPIQRHDWAALRRSRLSSDRLGVDEAPLGPIDVPDAGICHRRHTRAQLGPRRRRGDRARNKGSPADSLPPTFIGLSYALVTMGFFGIL